MFHVEQSVQIAQNGNLVCERGPEVGPRFCFAIASAKFIAYGRSHHEIAWAGRRDQRRLARDRSGGSTDVRAGGSEGCLQLPTAARGGGRAGERTGRRELSCGAG